MRRPIKTRKDLDISSNHFLRRNPGYPLGVTLTELDYLRGHKDDFFGDQIADEYDTAVVGAASAASLMDGAHGGWLRMITDTNINDRVRFWLGNNAGGYNTLDADEGWVMFARFRILQTTNIYGLFGASDSALARYIYAGMRTDAVANNWMLRCYDGVATTIDTGVAADTDPHWHALEVRPITGGREVKYHLDGNLLATCTTNVPTDVITPLLIVATLVAASREMRVDGWITIPRNL